MEGYTMTTSDNSHIAIDTLFEAARMKAELDAAAQSHLESCDHCRATLSWMETAAGMGVKETTYEPPQDAMEQVLRLGRNTRRLKQLRHFIVAALTFDSFNSLAPAGVRRSETTSRQVTYAADGIEIGLWLRRAQDGSMTLTGQVVKKSGEPIEDTTAHVDLVDRGEHIATSSLSKWGEFEFSNVHKGPYALQVSILDRVLGIPSLPVIDDDKPKQ
jgi:hypothetical protein